MRTQGAFYADTPHSGGFVWYDAVHLAPYSANLVLTRNALGDYSLNRTAAGAETYTPGVGLALLKRLQVYPGVNGMPFQEQFGTAAGAAGYPAGAAGLPPFTGATQLTQPTTEPPKGIEIVDVVAVYSVGVANLTAASLALERTTFANNVALAKTAVAIDATALPLTSAGDATGPYVVTRAVTTPAFEVTDLSDIYLELSVTMANTGTIKIYGLGAHVQFNYD